MFDLGWTELLVIGIVALIVVGPKDLPVLFRNAGKFVGRMRGMAREFSQAMNDAADEAGVNEIQKGLQAATNPVKTAMNHASNAVQDATDWDEESATAKLSEERARAAEKIQAKAAEIVEARQAAAAQTSAQTKPQVQDNSAHIAKSNPDTPSAAMGKGEETKAT